MMKWWGEVCSTARGKWDTGRPTRQVYFVRGGTVFLPRQQFSHIIAYGIAELGFIDLRPKPLSYMIEGSLFTEDGLEWTAELAVTLEAIDDHAQLLRIPIENASIHETVGQAVRGELAAAMAPLTYQQAQMISGGFGENIIASTQDKLKRRVPYRLTEIGLRRLSPKDASALNMLDERRRAQILSESFKAKHAGEIAAQANKHKIAEQDAENRHELERRQAKHKLALDRQEFEQQQELEMSSSRNQAIRLVIEARAQLMIDKRKDHNTLIHQKEQRAIEFDAMRDASALPPEARDALILGKDGLIDLKKVAASIDIARANGEWKQVRDIIGISLKGAAFGGKMEAYESLLRNRGFLPTEQTLKMELGLGKSGVFGPGEKVDTDSQEDDDVANL